MLKELNKTFQLQSNTSTTENVKGVAQSFNGLVGSINDGNCDHKFIAMPIDPNQPHLGMHIIPILYFVGSSVVKDEQHVLQFHQPFMPQTTELNIVPTGRKKPSSNDPIMNVIDDFSFLYKT